MRSPSYISIDFVFSYTTFPSPPVAITFAFISPDSSLIFLIILFTLLRKMALSEREELEAELQKALCKRFYCGDSKPSNPDEYDYLLSEIECDANAVNRRATEMFGDLDTYGGLTAIEMLGLAKILSVVESTDTENTNNIEIVMEKTESGLRVAEVLKKLGKKVEVVEGEC